MKKNVLMKSKRMAAFALSLSMILSEGALVNAGQMDAAQEMDAEVLDADIEDLSGTEAEQEDADAGIALTSEDELVLEEETEETLSDAKGAAVKPGTVGNFRFETKTNGTLRNSVLSWDNVQGADYYEIRVTDANGTEYGESYYGDAVAAIPYDNTSNLKYNLEDLIDYYVAYQKTADGTAYEMMRSNGLVYPVSRGGSYNIFVRAVKDGEKGDWSAPVSFTMSAATTAEVLSNVKLNAEAGETAYISYSLGEENDYAEVEVTDSQGRAYHSTYTLVNGVATLQYGRSYYGRYTLSQNSGLYVYEPVTDAAGTRYTPVLVDGKAVSAFQVGETYTIRLRGVNTTGAENTYSEWSAPITYTVAGVADKEAPEATGNVKYNASSNSVTWNESKGNSGYEVELTEAGQASVTKTVYGERLNGIEYVYDDDDEIISTTTNLKPSTSYTIRVRAFNWKGETQQFSEWTEAYTFSTCVERTDLEKVTGLKVTKNGISWTEAKDSAKVSGYELEIVDADGRAYTYLPTKNENGAWETRYYSVDDDENSTSLPTWLYTYVEVKDTDGVVTGYEPLELVSSNGSAVDVRAFSIPGKTYTVRVRAYRGSASTRSYGEWSDAVSYTKEMTANAGSAQGIQGAPAKVSGLVLKTEDEDATLSAPTLRWNSIEDVDHYEFEIKDSKGNSYTNTWNYVNHEYVVNYAQSTRNEETISNLAGLKAYIKNAGSTIETVQNAAGEDAKTFEAGETYTIRVRAVNVYKVWNANKNTWDYADYYYGGWSNAVTYKPGKSTALTGLKYVRSDEDNYYFTYKAVVDNSTVYYQIATDANFNSASKVTGTDWRYVSSTENLLAISKDSSFLEKGKTYYIRAVNYAWANKKDIDELTEAEIQALSPSVATFTTEAAKGPKNITGLKLYKETDDGYEFRFNAVLKDEDNDHYELQYTQDQNSANWYAVSNSTYIDRDDINEGTTYVRAVAYVYQLNELTGDYEKVYGAPSNVVTITKNRSTSAISKLKLSKKTNNGVYFTFSGTVRKGQSVKVQYSDSKSFADNKEYDIDVDYLSSEEKVNKEFYLSYYDLTPGKKYYVRARVENSDAKSQAEEKSTYTNVISFSTAIPKLYASVSSVTKNSITLHAQYDNNDTYVTGSEIQRKDGKKWVDVVKTSDSTYTDKKLKKDTTYSYRVRPYFYNPKTKKTTTGTWVYTEGTTWGAALNLTAKAASKTSVKLSWSKVSGAKGYEVYRKLGTSAATQISNGQGNGFTQYELVKSLGSKSKAYTDKGLTQGMGYNYTVVAYKTLNGKKVTISESDYVSLDWGMSEISAVQTSNGKVKWTWNPVYSAKGYLVEKQDNVTGKWSTYKNIKKAKTNSITLPKTSDQNGVTYRVRAYNGTKYTGALTCTVMPVLAVPGSVKAKASAKDGSITITWKKVKGADFYRVFRTTDSQVVYNKDIKGYVGTDAEEIKLYVADSSKVSGYREVTDTKDMNITKIVDKDVTYTRNGVTNTIHEGPKTGVTYYYYVKAYKKAKAYEYADTDEDRDGSTISSAYSKVAKAAIKPTAPKKVTLSSVKAAKNKVTVKYKKVKGVDGYDIFRSTSKSKGYEVVGTVTGDSKLSYVDKKSKSNELKKGKKYYYKVQAFTYDEAGQKVYGKASSVKNVKAK
ncbi:MAG: fibronectin type III domain-containing protein [Roseburia sp.]|nr:fibronectin type III domain-containing protein [Roseburia sp.]